MSDNETSDEKPFAAERAKQGRAVCKKCKSKCLQGELRIAKLVASPYGSGKMKSWHHVNCMFDVFLKQRPATKRLDCSDDVEGWSSLSQDDQQLILDKIQECEQFFGNKGVPTPKKPTTPKLKPNAKGKTADIPTAGPSSAPNKDILFKTFRKLIADITNVSSYLDKTKLVSQLFKRGSDGSGFKGDIVLWCKLLLPGVVKRIYNLQSKQLVKLFSRIFHANPKHMLEHLEQGDVGETIQHFFEASTKCKPTNKSNLTINQVDEFLEQLTKLTREDDQIEHFEALCPKCTSNDLKIVIRLIKHDLRMNAGAKHVLEGVHPAAYEAYQSSRDLPAVIKRCLSENDDEKDAVKARIAIMTPILPMLAEACKSVEQAMSKCPNGMFSEIKYDGERVQVHKNGDDFKYFSRSLKPVMAHKVAHFKDFIPKAFPDADELILDSEILMVDTTNGKPLPFGTLGVHKKNEFKDASVCLFVFDCIYYNGEDLTRKPIRYRKEVLRNVMKPIENHIVFSEMEEIHKPDDLSAMIAKVLTLGLEGLVVKDMEGVYEPGKRHWLKVKKDYLFGGAMADSADLIVLGAWFGTGKKGGIMSVFLMGSYNPKSKRFCTVTKVHTGHDDKTLERLQKELDMVKISMDASKVPDWLNCTKTMIPDFVARDPKKQPVWEITGAEFTQIHDVHTADGISIRFPRVKQIRDDKTWKEATNVEELKVLFENSKHFDASLLLKKDPQASGSPSGSPKKQKRKGDCNRDDEEPQKKKLKIIKNVVVNVKNPLPDVLFGLNFLFEPNDLMDKEQRIVRYLIAYGGDVLKDEQVKQATHVVHANKKVKQSSCKGFAGNPKHVTIDFVKKAIADKCVPDYRRYVVALIPD